MRRNEMTTYDLRLLRQALSPAEAALWARLRGRAVQGLKFRRQERLAGHIAVLLCHDIRLVIEVTHAPFPSADDLNRRADFASAGYRSLVLSEAEILPDMQPALIRIFRETRT